MWKNDRSKRMSKVIDPLKTTRLTIELLRRIPAFGRQITAKELHIQLEEIGIERDLRTIQRQLDMLSQHFGVVRYDKSKPYGYSWSEGSTGLEIPTMPPDVSLLLIMAKQHLASVLPANLMASMDSFFKQAERNLSGQHEHQRESKWKHKVRVISTSQPLLAPDIRSDVFAAVSSALYEDRLLEIEYCNTFGKHTKSTVKPLGLAVQGPRQYLVCQFEGHNDYRNIALHRLQSARMMSLTFERPADFNLKKYDNDGRFSFGKGELVRLSFIINWEAGKNLLETPLSKDQTYTQFKNGRYKITATVVDSELLRWFLNSFGDEISNIRKAPIKKKKI